MPQHTSAPWRVIKFGLDRYMIYPDKGGPVAHVYTVVDDANLIAASPELLEVLENLVDRIDGANADYGHTLLHLSKLRAQSAIAKAKGG